MKIRNEERFVRSSGLKSTNAFQISASSHMFRVLSDGMYSDKVTAVIRELTCNARDAHTAAGKESVPYTVHLPTQLEPHFSVRDEGIGLCFEDIMSLYTTYGESLKSDTNDMIGGLGLGSKVGFAYADQYTVEGRWDGEVHLFSCYVDEKGEPQIAHLNTTSTTDCNGLTVTIPVREKDVTEFKYKAESLFQYYQPRPDCNIGLEYTEKNVKLSGDEWEIYDRQGPSSYGYHPTKVTAIQGQVQYELDSDKLTGVSDHLKGLLRGINLDIWFSIGDLEVAANREDLSYSDFTIRHVEDKLKVVYDDILDKANRSVKGALSMWDASVQAHNLSDMFNNNSYLKDTILEGMEYGGQPIHSTSINMRHDELDKIWTGKIKYVPRRSADNMKLTFRPIENYGSWNIQNFKYYKFYFYNTADKKYKLPSTIQQDLEGVDKPYVVLLESTKAEKAKLMKFLGNPECTDVSSLTVPETVKRGARKVGLATLKLYNNTYYSEWYNDTRHQMEDGGVYVKLLRGYPSEDSNYDIKDKIMFLRDSLGDTTPVYGIPGTFHKRLDKHIKVWKTLDQHYESMCKKERRTLGNTTEINRFLVLSRTYRTMDSPLRNFLTMFSDDCTIKFKYDILNRTLKDYKEYLKLDIKYTKKNKSIEKLFSRDNTVSVDAASAEHDESMDKVWTKHPVLKVGLDHFNMADDLPLMKPDVETLLENWSN